MLRKVPRASIGVAVEHEAISVVAQPVERGRGEQTVRRKRQIPFGQIEVAGEGGGGSFLSLGNEFMPLDNYDYSFAFGAPRKAIDELATPRFIERGESAVLLGPAGVGKTLGCCHVQSVDG